MRNLPEIPREEKLVVMFDMDDIMCYYTEGLEAARKKNPQMSFPQAEIDFFRNLKPVIGAIEAFNAMTTNGDGGICELFDCWILTAPSVKNPLSYMEKRIWVENHLGYEACEKLIICPDKSLVKLDVLIDDMSSGKGQDRISGILIHPKQWDDNWSAIVDRCVEIALTKWD